MKARIILISLAAGLCTVVCSAQSRNFRLGKWTEIHTAILKELSTSYVDSLPVDAIERRGVDAMLSGLDPYTVYIPAEENEDLQLMISNTYGGIGAVIYKPDVNGNVIINEPYEGSPAHRYGLRCGDEIMQIDTTSVIGLNSQQCSERMKGEPGTKVRFKVKKVVPAFRPSLRHSSTLTCSMCSLMWSAVRCSAVSVCIGNVSHALRQTSGKV